MALCALLLVWRVYQWSQGKEDIYNIGTSLGFIFLFASMLIGNRNTALYFVLIGAAGLCLVGSLIKFLM